MKKKFLSGFLVAAMVISLLAGCGSSTSTDSSDTSSTDTATESATEETSSNAPKYDVPEGKQWDYGDMKDSVTYVDLVDKLWGSEVLVPNKKLTIGFIPKALENEFWQMVDDGIQEEVKKMQEAGFDVTVDTHSPQGETDEEGQNSIMLDMVNKKYDAIIVGPISHSNCVPAIERANEAGIPVIPIWEEYKDDPYLPAEVGSDSYNEGQLAAKYFAEQIGDEDAEVGIITGIASSAVTTNRTNGFSDYFKDNAPNIKVVDTQNADWDRSKAKDIADTMLKAHPDLKGIYCNNDTMALGAVEAVKGADKLGQVLVGGTDFISEAKKSIENKEQSYSTSNFPHYVGKISLVEAIRTLDGENLPENIISPIAGITPENVDKDEAEIVGWTDIQWVSEYSK